MTQVACLPYPLTFSKYLGQSLKVKVTRSNVFRNHDGQTLSVQFNARRTGTMKDLPTIKRLSDDL